MNPALQYLTINDFSPGIWHTGISATGTANTGRTFRPAPIGAARADRTSGCIALPGGGLGPLPSSQLSGGGGSNTINLPNPSSGEVVRGGSSTVQCIGLEVFGNVIAQTGQTTLLTPEINIAFNWVNNLDQERFRWYYYNMSSPGSGWTQAVNKTESGYVGRNLGIQTPHIFSTALTYTTTGFPQPILVGCWIGGSFGSPGSILAGIHYRWWLPDPGGGIPPQEISNANYIGFGFYYAHQSRVLCLRAGYQNHINPSTINRHNNEIDYTDPPLSTTMITPGTVLSAETAEGYGAIGSVSSGELFLVKKRGGGIIMYDDIDYPKVVRLPGIVSTGMVMQRGSFCSAGMLYVVEGSGVYAWDGSSTSKFVSPQLPPNFFMPTNKATVLAAGTLSYDTYVPHTPWMNWVYFSNGWLFDPDNGSWWRLEAFSAQRVWSTAIGPLLLVTDQWGPLVIRIFDARLPTQSYTWGSHAIPVSPGKKVDTREIEVEFTCMSADSSVQVDVYGDSGFVESLNFIPTVVSRPWRETKRLTNPLFSEHIRLEVTANGNSTDGAPIIHSISAGYTEDRILVSPWS